MSRRGRIGTPVEPLSDQEVHDRVLVTYKLETHRGAGEPDALWNGSSRTGWGGSLMSAKRANGTGFRGLRAAIEENHFTTTVTAVRDVIDFATVATPFSHIAICMRDPPQDTRGKERSIEEMFASDFGDWALLPPRVRYFQVHDLEQETILIYFGFGVFIPGRDEQPLAWLELASTRDREDLPWKPLRLPRGTGSDIVQPAAFYRGQNGVVFSYSSQLSPAHAPAKGLLVAGPLYFLGRLGDAPYLDATSLFHRPQAETERTRFELLTQLQEDKTERIGKAAIRWRRDGGPFALRHEPLPGPHLCLVGILVPQVGRRSDVEEWWIDLDAHGRLATSPVQGRRWSFASLPGRGRFRLYNRQDLANQWHDKLRPGEEKKALINTGSGNLHFFVRAFEDVRRSLLFMALARTGFGVISLASLSMAIIASGRTAYTDTLSLHWLDACSGVRRFSSGRHAEDQGLASWAHEEVTMKPSSKGLMLKGPKGQLARIEEGQIHDDAQELLVRKGERVIVGCCLFELRV